MAFLALIGAGCDLHRSNKDTYEQMRAFEREREEKRSQMLKQVKDNYAALPAENLKQRSEHLKNLFNGSLIQDDMKKLRTEYAIREWALTTLVSDPTLPPESKMDVLVYGLSKEYGSLYQLSRTKANLLIRDLRKDNRIPDDLREDFETFVRISPDITHDGFKGTYYKGRVTEDFSSLGEKLRERLAKP
jgi:hypothetical protein